MRAKGEYAPRCGELVSRKHEHPSVCLSRRNPLVSQYELKRIWRQGGSPGLASGRSVTDQIKHQRSTRHPANVKEGKAKLMSTSPQDQSSFGTYFVHEQHNEEELHRLVGQDRFVTASMGGVLAEQTDPAAFRRVLDVACGPGGWVIEAARTYPEMSLVGIDLNPRYLAYAREQAAAQQVEDRVEFRVMDALGRLAFPTASFDLVNLRFAISFVRTWEWPSLLKDMLRILRPGGVMRLTDEEVIHRGTSQGAMQFCEMLLCALFRSGHLFTPDSPALTARLAP